MPRRKRVADDDEDEEDDQLEEEKKNKKKEKEKKKKDKKKKEKKKKQDKSDKKKKKKKKKKETTKKTKGKHSDDHDDEDEDSSDSDSDDDEDDDDEEDEHAKRKKKGTKYSNSAAAAARWTQPIGTVVWVLYGTEYWPAKTVSKDHFDLSEATDFPNSICVQYFDPDGSISLTSADKIKVLNFNDAVSIQKYTFGYPDVQSALQRARIYFQGGGNNNSNRSNSTNNNNLSAAAAAAASAAASTANTAAARGGEEMRRNLLQQQPQPQRFEQQNQNQNQRQQQQQQVDTRRSIADLPPQEQLRLKDLVDVLGGNFNEMLEIAKHNKKVREQQAALLQKQTPAIRSRGSDFFNSNNQNQNNQNQNSGVNHQREQPVAALAPPPPRPGNEAGAAGRRGGGSDHKKNKKKDKKTTGGGGDDSDESETDRYQDQVEQFGNIQTWEEDIAQAVFALVQQNLSESWVDPKIIGAFTFEGFIPKGRHSQVRLHLPGDFSPHNQQVLLVPVATEADSAILPWMEELPLENDRVVRMKVKVGDTEAITVPSNWKIAVSKIEQLKNGRVPIPLDITNSVKQGIEDAQNEIGGGKIRSLDFSIYIQTCKSAVFCIESQQNYNKDEDEEEHVAVEWNGTLVALVVQRRKTDQELVQILSSRTPEQAASEASGGGGGGGAKNNNSNQNQNQSASSSQTGAVDFSCEIGRQQITSIDAITLQQIRVPVRSIFCQHPQSLDASSVVIAANRDKLWKCGICNIAAPFKSWFCDSDLQQIMKQHPGMKSFFAEQKTQDQPLGGGDGSYRYTYSVIEHNNNNNSSSGAGGGGQRKNNKHEYVVLSPGDDDKKARREVEILD